MSEQRCNHGMLPRQCSLCKKEEERKQQIHLVINQPRTAERRSVTTTPSRPTSHETANHRIYGDYAVIQVKNAHQPNFLSHLPERTTFIHMDGHPFLWIVKLLAEKIPNLAKLRVTPRMREKMGQEHLKALTEKGIELVTGFERPELAWKERENRSVSYEAQRNFLLGLDPTKKALFDELLTYGFEEAEMAARYFCLKGEPFIGQKEVATEFGYAGRIANSYVCKKIITVLTYLDPVQFVGCASQSAQGRLNALKHQVETARAASQEVEKQQEILARLGIERFPEKFIFGHLNELEAVHMARKDGRLASLKARNERLYKIVSERYGLEDNIFRTYRELGPLHEVTWQRAHQLIQIAYELLGIKL